MFKTFKHSVFIMVSALTIHCGQSEPVSEQEGNPDSGTSTDAKDKEDSKLIPDVLDDMDAGDADAPLPSVETCESDYSRLQDPACPWTSRGVTAFSVFGPQGPAHGVPGASFPEKNEDPSPPEGVKVAVGSCSPAMSAYPPCDSPCQEGQYCHKDGQCYDEPEIVDKDVGPVKLAVEGVEVGALAYEGTPPTGRYEAQGELSQRLAPIWVPGQTVSARNDTGLPFFLEAPAPADMNVTSFPFTPYTEKAKAKEPLRITWSAGQPGHIVEILFGVSFAYAACVAKDEDGQFSIPWQVIQDIFDLADGEFYVFVSRSRRTTSVAKDGRRISLSLQSFASQGYYFAP